MMHAKDFILTKIEVVQERIARLRQYSEGLSLERYLSDPKTKDAVERSLEVALQACIDIARGVIREKALRHPQDNKGVFVVLAEAGIISENTLRFLIPMAGTRNVLVHGYDRLDDELIYAVIQSRLADFTAFLEEIRKNYLGGT